MRPRTLAATALLALALTGCTGTPEHPEEPAASAHEQTVETETPAPLVAEEVAEPELSADDVAAAFIEDFHEARAAMPGESQIPNATDEQLIAAGREACERLDAGETSETIILIEGEVKNGAGYYSDSGAIITAARKSLCPEHIAG